MYCLQHRTLTGAVGLQRSGGNYNGRGTLFTRHDLIVLEKLYDAKRTGLKSMFAECPPK